MIAPVCPVRSGSVGSKVPPSRNGLTPGVSRLVSSIFFLSLEIAILTILLFGTFFWQAFKTFNRSKSEEKVSASQIQATSFSGSF
ncbi:MAG: hypothetical protein CVU46_03980 [Chloroflexi bacterium HGW-Chloroflexi-8]|nr:MAG: hypothetical protein CVU46_03980 [Chloroflexi bacterium HGW-Chloroflexi-8]